MQQPDDFKGETVVQQQPPMAQPQMVQAPMVQPPMMQVPPQQQYVQAPLLAQPGSGTGMGGGMGGGAYSGGGQPPYVVAQPMGYPKSETPQAVKSACMSAGVVFLLSSLINTVLIFMAMCIGWIPWFNYPFDILVVVVSCLTTPLIMRSLRTVKEHSGTDASPHYVLILVGGITHGVVLVGESINLVISLCPYAFYFLDSIFLMVLFVEFVMALVCFLAALM